MSGKNQKEIMVENMPANQPKTLDIPSVDQLNQTKTIYDVSGFEVFWRNFLAGMSRALGSIFVYFFLLYVLFATISKFLWPQLAPLFETLTQSLDTLNQLTPKGPANPAQNIMDNPALQQFLKESR